MRVLRVVDRILTVARGGRLNVKVNRGARTAGGKVPTCRIHTDLFEKLIKRHKSSGTLRHAHLYAVSNKSHPRHEKHLHVLLLVSERFTCIAHSSNGAVMICTPDIHQVIKTATKLLLDIADV